MDLNNAYARVIAGTTKGGVKIENRVFRLLGQLAREPNLGTYITVDGEGHADLRQGKNRIYLARPTDFELIDAQSGKAAVAPDTEAEAERTDDEIAAELKETFEIIAEMTEAVISGVVKGMVISGPAGIGKSHTVNSTLDETLGVPAALQGLEPSYEVISGHISPIMLYTALYRMADRGSVLVLDDCDVLEDMEALGILKAALDTKKVRRIHWGTASNVLEKEGVPTSFEFQGGVIFLTNEKLDRPRSAKLAPHFEAIVSRVHYVDVKIDSMREKILHIRNVVDNTPMLDEYELTKAQIAQVMNWLLENVSKLNGMDLRTVRKAAALRRAMPNNWQAVARRTLCKNAGR